MDTSAETYHGVCCCCDNLPSADADVPFRYYNAICSNGCRSATSGCYCIPEIIIKHHILYTHMQQKLKLHCTNLKS